MSVEPAVKVPIKMVLSADSGQRVRIMGRVVSKFVNADGTFASLTVDDETETVRVKFFKDGIEKANAIQPGDLVDVTGRVSEYQEEKSVICDTIAVLEDMNWELLRKLEIADTLRSNEDEILQFIKSRGEVKQSELEERWQDWKEAVAKLKAGGEIYEPEPGRFRIIE